MYVLNSVSQLLGNMGKCKIRLISNSDLSVKFNVFKRNPIIERAGYCKTTCPLDLEVTLITPGGVPGVFDEYVIQASGLINAISDSEYSMVDRVKGIIISSSIGVPASVAIGCIYNTARIGVDVLVIGCDSDETWRFINSVMKTSSIM